MSPEDETLQFKRTLAHSIEKCKDSHYKMDTYKLLPILLVKLSLYTVNIQYIIICEVIKLIYTNISGSGSFL